MKMLSFSPDENRRRISELARAVKAGDVIFFAGAALSMTCGLPLANPMKVAVAEMIAQRVAEEPTLSLLGDQDEGWTKIQGGKFEDRWWDIPLEVMFQFVVNSMGRKGLEPFSILDVGSRIYGHNRFFLASASGRYFKRLFTTNQDRLIENACNAASKRSGAVYQEAEVPEPTEPVQGDLQVVKLHGTVEDLESLVVTMAQAGEQLPPRKRQTLQSCLESKTMCFVGYGMGDYEIYSTIIESDARPPFILMRPKLGTEDLDNYKADNEHIIDVLERTSGTPILYDINGFFAELCKLLLPKQHGAHEGHNFEERDPPGREDIKERLAGWGEKISGFEALHTMGAIYHHTGLGHIGKRIYSIASNPKVAPSEDKRATALLGESMAWARQGQYQRAWGAAEKAKSIAEEIADEFLLAEACYHSGSALRQAAGGFTVKGLLRLKRAEQIYGEIGTAKARHGRGSALLSLALMWRSLIPKGRIFNPIRRKILLQLRKSYGLLSGPNGNAMRIIADVHRELGQTEQAMITAKRAELICDWHRDDVGMANTKRAEARIHEANGEVALAKEAYSSALRASLRAGDRPGILKGLNGLRVDSDASQVKSRHPTKGGR